jgi:predicted ester cyclase
VLFAAFPDQLWTLEEQAAEGEKVWSGFTWRVTHRGEFMGIPPTGRAVAVKGMVIDRFVDGKWTESRILMDNLGMMQQLGVIPEPGQSGEPEPT